MRVRSSGHGVLNQSAAGASDLDRAVGVSREKLVTAIATYHYVRTIAGYFSLIDLPTSFYQLTS